MLEIIGYMGIGYIILSVINWFINLFSPTYEVSVEELVTDVIEWCFEVYPVKKKFPIIIISTKKSKYMGTYNFYSNVITIYLKHHLDSRGNVILNSLISTSIHEYFHLYLQTSTYRISQYERMKYEWGNDGPHEWINEAMEEKLTPIYLQKRFNKMKKI